MCVCVCVHVCVRAYECIGYMCMQVGIHKRGVKEVMYMYMYDVTEQGPALYSVSYITLF